MTIYEEMQALKDSVEQLQKKLEELKNDISTEILDSKALYDAIRTEIRENIGGKERESEQITLLLSVLVNKVDELSEHTMISLRERQLMDDINKRANKIRAERKKKKWR